MREQSLGPSEIKPNEDYEYRVGGSVNEKWPIKIIWKTLTGKRQVSVWMQEDYYSFRRIGRYDRFCYFF